MSGMNRIELGTCRKILDTLPAKYACLFALGIGTGCRISELLCLRRGDLIDPATESLRSPVRFVKLKSKKEKFRDLIIPDQLAEYVKQHLNAEMERGFILPTDYVFRGHKGRHLSRFTVYAQLKHTFAVHGLNGKYATHSMRKTFAHAIFNYFLKENPNDPMRALEMTRIALGHDRIDNTVKYLGITHGKIYKAQNAIFKDIRC